MTDPTPNPTPNPTPDPAPAPTPTPGTVDLNLNPDPAPSPTPDPIADWRKSMAGDDEKALKVFERYATPQDFGKAHLEAVNKIRSGEFSKPLPKDATAEQVAEWRKGNGIPDKPEGYFEQLPNGLVIGEDDKPLFDGFAAALHELNAPPALIHKTVEWYYGMQDQQVQAQQVADNESRSKLEGALKTAWGNDFRANANVYQSFIASAPKEVHEALTSARDVDGNFVLYRPEVVSWLVGLARESNPEAYILPNSGDGGINSIQGEIDQIEKFMRETPTAYYKDQAKQDRLLKLYDARIKLQQRGRAA